MTRGVLLLVLLGACSSATPVDGGAELGGAELGGAELGGAELGGCSELGGACGECCGELVCGPAYVGATSRACLSRCATVADCSAGESCQGLQLDAGFIGTCQPIPGGRRWGSN